MVIRNLGVHMKKNPSLSHTEKENQYKYSKSLNLQPKTLTLLDVGKSLQVINVGKDLLKRTPIAQVVSP